MLLCNMMNIDFRLKASVTCVSVMIDCVHMSPAIHTVNRFKRRGGVRFENEQPIIGN